MLKLPKSSPSCTVTVAPRTAKLVIREALEVPRSNMRLLLAPALRLAPWLCVPTIAILSLVPGQARPHTGLPGQAEHFLAYLMTALVLGCQARNLTSRITLAIALCAYGGMLEVLQIWIPGRSAQVIDFAASSFGALTGVLLSALLSLSTMSRPKMH